MEILLTAAALPVTDAPDAPPALEPAPLQAFDWHQLVDPDLWSEVPADVPELIRLLADSDLYVQDEVDVRLDPTLHRVRSRKGKRGQRQVRAPGKSHKFVGFGAIDWRDGWLSVGYSLSHTADVFRAQLDHLVERASTG